MSCNGIPGSKSNTTLNLSSIRQLDHPIPARNTNNPHLQAEPQISTQHLKPIFPGAAREEHQLKMPAIHFRSSYFGNDDSDDMSKQPAVPLPLIIFISITSVMLICVIWLCVWSYNYKKKMWNQYMGRWRRAQEGGYTSAKGADDNLELMGPPPYSGVADFHSHHHRAHLASHGHSGMHSSDPGIAFGGPHPGSYDYSTSFGSSGFGSSGIGPSNTGGIGSASNSGGGTTSTSN